MAFWGEIRGVAAQRGTSTDLWNAIRAAAAAVPGGAPTPTLSGVNEVWSAAVRLRNTGEVFSKALALEERTGLAQSVTSDMLSTAPWSRENLEPGQQYKYQVSFQGHFQTPDEELIHQHLTVTFGANELPETVGQLREALELGIPNTSIPAGVDLVGLGDLSIAMV